MFNLSSSTMLLVDVSLAAGPKNIRNVYWIHDCHTCESRLASLYVSLDPTSRKKVRLFKKDIFAGRTSVFTYSLTPTKRTIKEIET